MNPSDSADSKKIEGVKLRWLIKDKGKRRKVKGTKLLEAGKVKKNEDGKL